MFKKIKNLVTVVLILIAFAFSSSMFATNVLFNNENDVEQEIKYRDVDLISFVKANREISTLRREVNEEINDLVEDHGLTMERFNQIARASQIGALEDAGFSSEDIDAFNTVAPQVTELRREMRGVMQGILQEKELSQELYQEILADYRQDSEMQAFVQELMRERRREEAFQKRKKELMEEKGLTEEEAEERIIRRSQSEEEN